MSVLENISYKLNTTEKTENIRILHAVESGSRAWGFASPDSDYDVRFIYLRPENYYLRLDKTRDVIECELNDVYDINGWDISKTLRLLHNSNPTVFEWIHSPIVYSTHDVIKQLTPEIDSFFSCKSGIYHYISTALSNSHYLKPEQVRYKKYFYVIHPVMACLWILENKTPPPVLFSELVSAVADDTIKPLISELIRIKTEIPETATGKHIPALDRYIEKNIKDIKKYAGTLPDDRKNNWSEINEMFLKILDIK